MSRLYFHEQGNAAALRGPEAYYLFNYANKLAITLLGLDEKVWVGQDDELYDRIMFPSLSIDRSPYARRVRWQTAASVLQFDQYLLMLKYDAADVGLNTALALGSRPVKLLTRFAAQAEVALWFEEAERPFVAEIIREGLASKFYRQNVGWEEVLNLIESGCGPVAMSHSVSSNFPREDYLLEADRKRLQEGHDPEELEEWWYSRPEEERWALNMAFLRDEDARKPVCRRVRRDNFDAFFFGDGVTAMQVAAEARAELYAQKGSDYAGAPL